MDAGALVAERFLIERRIARGGQACVYLAQQLQLDRKVALKVLSSPPTASLQEQRQFQQRFLKEARTLASLNHPNIVTVFDYGHSEDGTCFIAMEYIEGTPANKVVNGPMEPERARRIICQVVNALQFAHAHGVIHRDIKSSNVLVSADGRGGDVVKVVDFGIAKLTTDDTNITIAGTILGSPHFMSPEQIYGRTVDYRADIYAVGVLFYYLLAGKYPFSSTTSHMLMNDHLHTQAPQIRERSPQAEVPGDVEAVVMRCLQKEPNDRYGSAHELLLALEELNVETLSMVAPHRPGLPPMNPSPSKSPNNRRLFLGMVMVGLVAMSLALGVASLTYALFADDGTQTAPATVAPEVAPDAPPAPSEAPVDAEPAVNTPPVNPVSPSGSTQPPASPPPAAVAPPPPTSVAAPPPVASTATAPPEAPSAPPQSADAPSQSADAPAAQPAPEVPEPAAATPDPAPEDDSFSIDNHDIRDPWGGR